MANANSQLETGNIGNGNTGNTGKIPMWVDVVAEGVTPTVGVDYTFRFTFDYRAKTYGVEVQTGLTEFTRLLLIMLILSHSLFTLHYSLYYYQK